MKTLALATAALAALTAALAALTAATPADARPVTTCLPWRCNGPQLTGIALPSVDAKRPVVNAVTLSSGETVDLR
jgi:hypothetical protein